MGHPWARALLADSLCMRRGERVLILVDQPLRDAGEVLSAQALELGASDAQAHLLPAPGRFRMHGVSAAVLQLAGGADIILLLLTGLDLTQENPVLRAARAAFATSGRGRWASGAMLDPDRLAEDLAAPAEIAAHTARMAAALQVGSAVRLTAPNGTDLHFSIRGREVHQETGRYGRPGEYGNLPGGEVFVAPVEESAEGTVVFDLSLGDIPLDRPVRVRFRSGRAVEVEGGSAAAELRRRISGDPWLGMAGEFGLGANPAIRPSGRVTLDEKVLGTVHVALGGNQAFGGLNPGEQHLDGVLTQPRIYLDGRLWMYLPADWETTGGEK